MPAFRVPFLEKSYKKTRTCHTICLAMWLPLVEMSYKRQCWHRFICFCFCGGSDSIPIRKWKTMFLYASGKNSGQISGIYNSWLQNIIWTRHEFRVCLDQRVTVPEIVKRKEHTVLLVSGVRGLPLPFSPAMSSLLADHLRCEVAFMPCRRQQKVLHEIVHPLLFYCHLPS